VGANWGYYTLLASHLVGKLGQVISFEPDPRLFPILMENIRYNGLSNITALQFAAAAEAGILILSGYDAKGDNHGLSRIVESAEPHAQSFQVQSRPIDNVLDELGVEKVDLLKMDIEGAEDLALQGMNDGLSRHRFRRILLELHPAILAERGRSSQSILDLMKGKGYKGWWIDFSPAATRRAAYATSINLQNYLSPLDDTHTLDSWPHILWLAPNTELPV
jgi:FkbM family methyltransferase